MIIETDRLYLREMTENDYNDICEILKDRETMYAYEHAFSDEEVRAWILKQFKSYEEHVFGLWAAVLRENGKMIGQCGITIQDFLGKPVHEIGYLFNRNFWHNGYATESARACARYAFDSLGLERVYSIIRDMNIPSQNVALRIGMSPCGTLVKHYYGIDMPHIVFSTGHLE